MSADYPMEIGHIEEIEEHIVDQDDGQTTTYVTVEAAQPQRRVLPGQKIVVIQNGGNKAVRVLNNPSSPVIVAGSSSAGVAGVQYVKTENGVVQVRRTPAAQVVQRVITPSKPGTKIIVQKTPQPATVTKTITMAQARQMGLITSTDSPARGASSVQVKSGPEVTILNSSDMTRKIIRAQPVESPNVVRMVEHGTPKQVVVKTEPKYVVSAKKDETKVRVSNQTANRLSQLQGSVVLSGQSQSKAVLLPPTFMQQMSDEVVEESVVHEEETEGEDIGQNPIAKGAETHEDFDIKKRPCNCTKSQCLKLYCECFANGEFCKNCNCKDCYNTLEHEDERQTAIYCCLERNPNAFRPKIGKISSAAPGLRHHKGCHCKRSGCLKNYCECFEAKISCTDMCRCVGCKNSDDKYLHTRPSTGAVSAIKRAAAVGGVVRPKPADDEDEPPPKQPCNFMTAEVVDATVQCLMAQADECQQNGVSFRNTERLILEEFGRCLGEIIEFSQNQEDSRVLVTTATED